MKTLKKINLSTREKNLLLEEHPGFQDVEKYDSLLGILYCYHREGKEGVFIFKGKTIGKGIKEIQIFKGEIYLFVLSSGKNDSSI